MISEWWAVLPIRIKKEFHEAIEHALIVRCMNLENPSEPYHCDYLDYTYYHRGTSKRLVECLLYFFDESSMIKKKMIAVFFRANQKNIRKSSLQ